MDINESSQNVSKAGRQPKRKLTESTTGTGKKGRPAASDLSVAVKLPQHGYPLDHPYNKEGYRYILAEPDPHAPFRQEYDESPDWAGKPIPGWLYRVLTPNAVLVALHDRAPQMRVSEDRLSITGDKGYCTTRCSHFVSRGAYYWEATIEDMPDGSATRIGWGQEYANLQSPLGYDKFGYSWRSRKGTKFHESHGRHYSEGYGEGDTLGFLIDLPEQEGIRYLPNTYKDRPLVKFKSHLYYEDKDKVSDSLKNLKIHPRSKISFFKNGKCQGVAFENIYSGSYYPSVSIHKNASVSLNFGAEGFKYPEILTEYNCKAMHERVEAFICEQTMADLFFFTENDGKLRL